MTHDLPTVLVFHSGALGDSVLLWPMLRRWSVSSRVILVTERAKAALAAEELGVGTLPADLPEFAQLWRTPGASDGPPGPLTGPALTLQGERVGRVVSFLTDDAAGIWAANARRAFPNAAIELRPAPIDRRAALCPSVVDERPVLRRVNARGPMVLHVGAGSRSKRWPLERWQALTDRLREGPARDRAGFSPPAITVVAGEVEAEQFDRSERSLFERLKGCFIFDLPSLAALLRSAVLVVGNDSGPTHLAAQLGVRTVALFGPTDPHRWAPIGPWTTVVAPASLEPMTWLSAELVADTIRA